MPGFVERADPGISAGLTPGALGEAGVEHDQELHDALVHIGSALDLLAAFVPPDGPALRLSRLPVSRGPCGSDPTPHRP